MDEPPGRDAPARIESAFRNGSITAVSVLLGFSLSFLARWAALPGAWTRIEVVTAGMIAVGIVCEVVAAALLLSVRSLEITRYERAIAVFLLGLGFVAAGVAIAIVGDISGIPQHVLPA